MFSPSHFSFKNCRIFSRFPVGVRFFAMMVADDYRAHTSCMTEAERYEGKLYKPKKRNPQEEWMDIVETCAESAPAHLKNYLQSMCELDNIPRKEKQFRNFTMNSLNLRGRGEGIVCEVWNLLKGEREKRMAVKQAQEQEAQKRRKQEQEEKNQVRKSASAKGNIDDSDGDSDNESAQNAKELSKEASSSSSKPKDSVNKKKVKKLMKKALKKAPNGKMKLKALRKHLGRELGLSKKGTKSLKKLLVQASKDSNKSKILIVGKMISME